MIDFIAVVVMLAGVVFLFAAMLGLLRFADPLQRIHATTKSGTVGAGLILLGLMIHMGDAQAVFRPEPTKNPEVDSLLPTDFLRSVDNPPSAR